MPFGAFSKFPDYLKKHGVYDSDMQISLPSPEALIIFDALHEGLEDFPVDVWRGKDEALTKRLREVEQFHADLAASLHPNTFVVAGGGLRTQVALRVGSHRPLHELDKGYRGHPLPSRRYDILFQDGDGTVSITSSTILSPGGDSDSKLAIKGPDRQDVVEGVEHATTSDRRFLDMAWAACLKALSAAEAATPPERPASWAPPPPATPDFVPDDHWRFLEDLSKSRPEQYRSLLVVSRSTPTGYRPLLFRNVILRLCENGRALASTPILARWTTMPALRQAAAPLASRTFTTDDAGILSVPVREEKDDVLLLSWGGPRTRSDPFRRCWRFLWSIVRSNPRWGQSPWSPPEPTCPREDGSPRTRHCFKKSQFSG
ncbi:MAG: hypothetical protein HC923_08815 [Myxococcales bacterium]|nr:hypothetical protein [Myxococcales bacterium]